VATPRLRAAAAPYGLRPACLAVCRLRAAPARLPLRVSPCASARSRAMRCPPPGAAVLAAGAWELGGAAEPDWSLEAGGLEEEWRTPSAAVGRSVEDALGGGS
jgi:hypothetical protein